MLFDTGIFSCLKAIFDQKRASLYNAFGNPDLLASVLITAEINTIDVLC